MGLTQVKTTGLADDAVTLAKQAAGTDGQIITYDASGNPTAVGPGTDGQVLTSTGAGSPPAFEALPASGATINNATENEIVTVASTTTQLDAESGLTFDGNTLAIGAKLELTHDSTDGARFINTESNANGSYLDLVHDSSSPADDDQAGVIRFRADDDAGNEHTFANIKVTCPDVSNGAESGEITFTTSSAGAIAERIKMTHDGNLSVLDGNLVVAAGHGLDFSAVGAGSSVTAAENLLDDYECGTWTPAFTTGTVTSEGYYVKVGNLVHVTFKIHSWSDDTSGSPIQMIVRPFAAPRVKTIFSTQLTHFGSSPAVMHLETNNLWYLQYQTPSGGTSNFNHSDISDKTSSNLWVSGTYTIA